MKVVLRIFTKTSWFQKVQMVKATKMFDTKKYFKKVQRIDKRSAKWIQKVKKNFFWLLILAALGHILSCVRPFYERAVSDLERSMHRSLWV